MVAPSNFKVAIACGVGGAYVDVTASLRGNEPVSVSAGRESQFDATPPGVFSFTLDNSTGDYTPDNPNSALATRLVENMGVTVQIGSRVTSGTIRSIVPFFRSTIGSSAQVRITCDDMLGDAGRQGLSDFPDAMVNAATRFLLWPLNEAANEVSAAEVSGGPDLLAYTYDFGTAAETGGWVSGSAFGSEPQAANLWRRLRLCGTSTSLDTLRTALAGTTFQYPTTSMGFWNFWGTATGVGYADVRVFSQGGVSGFTLRVSPSTFYFTQTYGSTSSGASVAITPGFNYFSVGATTTYSAGSWFRQFTVYVNGVAVHTPAPMNVGATLDNTQRQPTSVSLQAGSSVGPDSTYLSRLSHTLELAHEETLIDQTLTGMISALRYAAPSLTMDTAPATMSTAPANFVTGASSALARLNEIANTEQGHMYLVETGTLTAPVPKIRFRVRDRPTTVAYTFSTATEIADAPDFARSISDAVSSVAVSGPTASVSVSNSSMIARFGAANTSARIASMAANDLRSWGEDRINRGIVQGVPITSITINARNTPTDRWGDLTAMIPGDRIRVTDLPSAQLGYSTWDGWLLGKKESHDSERGMFTLYLQPVLPDTAILDTDRFMADGILTLSASINSSVTSLSVATTGATLDTVGVPYTIIIGTEKMTVTACTGATPQVLTVTRGAGGTTAAAHTAADLVEISPTALLAF